MYKPCLLLLLLLLSGSLFGQRIEKVQVTPASSSSGSYTIIYPPKLPWAGVLFLVSGMGETPEDVLQQTHLPTLAAQKGLLTIIPTFTTGVLSFGIDPATQESFKEIIQHVYTQHKLNHLPMYVGGFSIGGSCAVKFAAFASATDYRYKPAAVFAIDPPLDFERFYHAAKRNVRLSKEGQASAEAVYMIGQMEKHMGGSPATALKNYHSLSPYSFSDTSQTAVKQLLNTPLRLYAEPDVAWWLSERGYDYSGMNAFDAAAMINELRRLGNKEARLVTTTNKGYRKPAGNRHPHSWSIADPEELLQWLTSR